MNKLATLISNGEITVQELADAKELIERAELVREGVKACSRTLVFPLGCNKIECYSYTDSAGEYSSWGTCTAYGIFTCYCNWGGNHENGGCNLTDFTGVFMAFENSEFAGDLRRFLLEQIEKANIEKAN